MSTASGSATVRERLSDLPLPSWTPRLQPAALRTPPDPTTLYLSSALLMVGCVLMVILVNLTLVGQVQHFTAQHRLYDELRLTLAEGSVPIAATTASGQLVAPGTPIALLEIPELGVKEVVVEGTASDQTKLGVGHRRDTPFPGQPGVSVLLGRHAGYGGVFAHLDTLSAGQTFTVTTGQGVASYRVIGPRVGETQLPAMAGDDGRITLVTASGAPYVPSGVTRVDAELVSKPFPVASAARPVIADNEQALASDTSGAVALSWLLELLVVLTVAAVWAWRRWSRGAAWIVFTPVVLVVALASADRVCSLLPNLT